MKVSLIIPIYNEIGHLEKFLKAVDELDLAASGCTKELVLIDDCSKDGSRELLQRYNFKSAAKIHACERNQGKGAAIRRGIGLATGEIIGVQDADFEYDMNDIPAILTPLVQNRADIVFGSRFKQGSLQVHRTFHYMVNRLLTMFSNLLSGLYLSDMETCYKFFAADIIKNVVLTSDRFGFEPEVTAKVSRLKVRVMETPISYFPRNYLEGKKITWRDGIAALRHILHFNLRLKPENCFLPTMPERFRASNKQWL